MKHPVGSPQWKENVDRFLRPLSLSTLQWLVRLPLPHTQLRTVERRIFCQMIYAEIQRRSFRASNRRRPRDGDM